MLRRTEKRHDMLELVPHIREKTAQTDVPVALEPGLRSIGSLIDRRSATYSGSFSHKILLSSTRLGMKTELMPKPSIMIWPGFTP